LHKGSGPAWVANIFLLEVTGHAAKRSTRLYLKTFDDGDGAVLGTHPVAIRATEMLGPKKIKWHAPKKYANDQSSGLTATMDGPTDSLVIELTWDGGKPFIEILEPEAGASSMY